MAFRVHYRPLTVITIRHGFHLNIGRQEFDDLDPNDRRRVQKLAEFNIFDDLRLGVPDETRRTLQGLGLMLKETRTGLVIACSVAETSRGVFVPERIPDRAYCLRFLLHTRAPLFWDYTNLDLGANGPGTYYLSNRAGVLGGQFPYLSRPPHTYVPGDHYAAGEIVRPSAVSDERFLAVRGGSLGAPVEGDLWRRIGERNYLNSSDLIDLHARRFRHRLAAEDLSTATADLIGADGVAHRVGRGSAPPGEGLDHIDIDACNVVPGWYQLRIEGRAVGGGSRTLNRDVYIDAALASSGGAFAILELFHEPGEALGAFRLYDEAAGFRLREPELMVHLLNRHTFWRYRFADPPPANGDLGDLELVADQFVTRQPMPLTRGVERVRLGADRLLPNPPGGPIVPEADRMYSDIHVHLR